jgi:diphosphate-dependent phosphofructokinase
MDISALQKARYSYQPKLPPALRGTIGDITVKLGAATESVANQAELRALFPKTYGAPVATVESGKTPQAGKKLTLAVVLSGGQAPADTTSSREFSTDS